MFRKTIFAVAAVATIIATALVPTTASAKGFKGGWGHHWGYGIGAAGLALSAAAISNCYRYVETRDGGVVRVNVCD
jgi:uncharacterized membrane protein